MDKFTIVPRSHGYWIEVIAENGSRKPIERYDTEDAAVQRLRVLQQTAKDISERNAAMTPRTPH
jgi:hypothetical protein